MKKLLIIALAFTCNRAASQSKVDSTFDSTCVCWEKDLRIGPGQVRYSGNFRHANDSTVVSRWGKVYVRRGRWFEFVKYCPEAKW